MLKRKDKILISAIELLFEEGTSGITTKQLAKRQGVSEPALYRQYKNKQAIVRSIVAEFGLYDEMIFNTIRQSSLTGSEAIKFYVNRFAEMYQNYSELTTVMLSMDLYFYNEETKQMMTAILEGRNNFLKELIEENSNKLFLTDKFNAEEMASLINGIILSQVLEWRLSNCKYSLDKRLNTVIDKIIG